MTYKDCIQSKWFRRGVVLFGIMLVALTSFGAGVAVGLHKARFSYAWGENYERHFVGDPRERMFRMMGNPEGRGFRNPHGTIGTIVSVVDDTYTVQDRDGQESTVRITDQTDIVKQRKRIARGELKEGETIVVIGKPSDDGVVDAELIRVFDRDGDEGFGMPFGRGGEEE